MIQNERVIWIVSLFLSCLNQLACSHPGCVTHQSTAMQCHTDILSLLHICQTEMRQLVTSMHIVLNEA